MIEAPFSEEQVEALNAFQQLVSVHPYTCGRQSETHRNTLLVATRDGWRCPDESCNYTQATALAGMADARWIADRREIEREMARNLG